MAETATLAAGCFWGVEQAFREVDGVRATEVGYIGGDKANPTYEEVCRKKTGHAEAVRVIFDPAIVSYEDLLGVFWKLHDPTQVDRQGPDVGDQYRTAIFTHNEDQARAAAASKKAESEGGAHRAPIATTIEPAGQWWRAEDYHQQYVEKNGGGVCAIRPK